MSKEKNDGEQLVEEIHKLQKSRFNKWLSDMTAPARQLFKGLWLFAEGISLLITSLYAIYQGHYGNLPQWGAYILTIAGVLVLIPGALLLAKFFRNASRG